MKGDLPAKALAEAVAKMKAALAAAPKEIATRTASEHALEVLTAAVPEMIGGSADLTGSNNTRVKGMVAVSANNYGGRYVNYGIREHGMAAAMNGMALHGGLIPYSGTFLVFSDYLRPALRLAALMGERVIHVLTHDSIGLGEDGPTHQPVEHVAALRAIPNSTCSGLRHGRDAGMLAARPEASSRPSVLALTRQNLPQLRLANDADNKCANGAYEISKADGEAKVSIFASGSEVSLAVERRSCWRGHSDAGGFGALHGPAAGASRRQARRHHRQGAGEGRGRSRHPSGLGCHHRFGRHFRRHGWLRRQRPTRTCTGISASPPRPWQTPRRPVLIAAVRAATGSHGKNAKDGRGLMAPGAMTLLRSGIK
jgi:transketolase C-terminal domain/subunit